MKKALSGHRDGPNRVSVCSDTWLGLLKLGAEYQIRATTLRNFWELNRFSHNIPDK